MTMLLTLLAFVESPLSPVNFESNCVMVTYYLWL